MQQLEESGEPLSLMQGWYNKDSNFASYRFGAGDTILVITVGKGVFYLLGSMQVVTKGIAQDIERRGLSEELSAILEGLPRQAHCVLGTAGSGVSLRRALRPTHFSTLEYWSKQKVEAYHNFDDTGRAKSGYFFKGVRFPTKESGDVLAELAAAKLMEAPAGSRALRRDARALFELLLQKPRDREAATVLADLYNAHDDPMGQVTELELKLQSHADPGLRRELAKLAKRRFSDLIGRPGGYPFSPGWAPSLLDGLL